MFRYLITLLLSFTLLVGVQAEDLRKIWPSMAGKGRFDELRLRYTISDRLTLLAGSRLCLVDGQVRELQAPTMFFGNSVDVSPELGTLLSVAGMIDNRKDAEGKDLPVVVLDPGHGGKDPGAIGKSGTYEKDVVLDIALRVRRLLKRKSVAIQMTRDKDVFVELAERSAMSNRWKATTFVSLHANAGPPDLKGFSLYTMSDKKTPDQRADLVRSKFPLPVFAPTGMNGRPTSHPSHESLFRWKDRESLRLMDALDRSLHNRNPSLSTRRKANFSVLRGTMAPSVLVEIDFISNPEVEIYMTLEGWRERIAREVADGILTYLGLEPLS